MMGIPYAQTEEDVLKKYQQDVAYRAAISEINTALRKRGFTNVKDLNSYNPLIDRVRNATKNGAQRDRIKRLIEELPVDLIIQAELIWITPARPLEKQVQMLVQAIDKHTGTIYASGYVESYARDFQNLTEAVRSALTRDGKVEFNNFLSEIELALMQKRALAFHFDVASVSPVNFNSTIKGKTTNTWIKKALERCSLDSLYRINGESALSIKGEVYESILDASGNYIQPGELFKNKLISFLRSKGIKISYVRAGRQLVFRLEGVY